jgi:hypothetical protein
MQPKNPTEKLAWQAPQLELIETEETQSGDLTACFEDTFCFQSSLD